MGPMDGRFSWGMAAAGVLALAASCGGKVVFEENSSGTGGTGATGTGATGTGATGTGASGTGASGTGGAGNGGVGGSGNVGNGPSSLEQVCTDACEGILGTDCYLPQDCLEQCMFSSTFECEGEWIAVIQCIDQGASCQFPPACETALVEWDQCESGGCAEECWTDDGFGCGCYIDCGPEMFETSCYGEPNQPSYCDCYANGGYVGTCSGGPLTCGVWDSCCSQYWGATPG